MYRFSLVLLLALAACGPEEVPDHTHDVPPHEHPAPEPPPTPPGASIEFIGDWVGTRTEVHTVRKTGATVKSVTARVVRPVWVVDGVLYPGYVCMLGYAGGIQGEGTVVQTTVPVPCGYREQCSETDNPPVTWTNTITFSVADGVLTEVVRATYNGCDGNPVDVVHSFTGRK